MKEEIDSERIYPPLLPWRSGIGSSVTGRHRIAELVLAADAADREVLSSEMRNTLKAFVSK